MAALTAEQEINSAVSRSRTRSMCALQHSRCRVPLCEARARSLICRAAMSYDDDPSSRANMKTKLAIVSLLCGLSASSLIAQAIESSFFKTSDGVRIHYLAAGTGPGIVFVPGWMLPAWIWQKQIEEFSKKYRVIAVDPRSQGESEKPHYGHLPEIRARDYKELVDHVGLKRPVLVGWSMGCVELMKYVEQFGTENLAALVLVDGLLPEKPNGELFVNFATGLDDLQQNRQKQTDLFVRGMFKKPQAEDYLKRLMDATLQVPTDTAVTLSYNMIAAKDISADLAKTNRPMLYLYEPGTQDTADLLKSKLGDKVQLEDIRECRSCTFRR